MFWSLVTENHVMFIHLHRHHVHAQLYNALPGSAGEVLVLSVWDVLPCPVVPVLLGQTKVYQEELVAVSPDPHQEVVGLDVPVDEVLVVDILDPPDHLVGQHEDGLHGEPPGAEVEEVLQAWPEKVHDEHIVVALLPVPAYVWYSYSSLKENLSGLWSARIMVGCCE